MVPWLQVLASELDGMKKAFKQCEEEEGGMPCRPAITFALIIKRHHVRFDRMHLKGARPTDHRGYDPTAGLKGFVTIHHQFGVLFIESGNPSPPPHPTPWKF